MCGIAGIARQAPTGVTVESLGRMAAAIRHRGPDGYGFYYGRKVGLAHVKLSVVDIGGDGQPLTNEDGQIVLASTCEVFNHPELRHELEERGHVFRTQSHAEVLVHGYEEWGPGLLQRLDESVGRVCNVYDRNRETCSSRAIASVYARCFTRNAMETSTSARRSKRYSPAERLTLLWIREASTKF